MSERSAAIQHHRNHLRLGWRVVVILLLITSVLAFLGVSAVRQDAAILLNPESIRELVTMVGALLVVVVALVGVYSVIIVRLYLTPRFLHQLVQHQIILIT